MNTKSELPEKQLPKKLTSNMVNSIIHGLKLKNTGRPIMIRFTVPSTRSRTFKILLLTPNTSLHVPSLLTSSIHVHKTVIGQQLMLNVKMMAAISSEEKNGVVKAPDATAQLMPKNGTPMPKLPLMAKLENVPRDVPPQPTGMKANKAASAQLIITRMLILSVLRMNVVLVNTGLEITPVLVNVQLNKSGIQLPMHA